MKFLFEAEDCLVGIGAGALLIGLSGKYYHVPDWKILWGIVFSFCLVLTLLDIIHTFHDLSFHPFVLILSFLQNAIDGVLELALAASFFGLSIPKLSPLLAPYLANPAWLFYMGVFIGGTSLIWLIMWPFIR